MSDPRIEIVAEALWKLRAKDAGWGKDWQRFSREKPEIAGIYRWNAQAAVKAMEECAHA